MKFKRIIFLNDSTKSHISKNSILFNLSTCLQLHHKSSQIDAVGKFKYLSNLIDSSLSWRLCRSEFSFSEKNYFHSWEVLCSTKGNFSIEFRKIWKVNSLYICLQELRIISFSVVNMTEKLQSLMVRKLPLSQMSVLRLL